MYQRILVPIDGSSASKQGLLEAIKIGKNQGSQIRLFHIVTEQFQDCGYASGTYGDALVTSARQQGHRITSEAEACVNQAGLESETVMIELPGGYAAASILTQAKEWPADLIVMGTHGRKGLIRLAMGSDAESVVRNAIVPVLLVHEAKANHVLEPCNTGASGAPADVLYA